MKIQLEIEEIKKLLPQRFPFLMIDRVLEASSEKVVAIKNITATEQFFKGHFPGQPIMPGALIIEAMAQTGLILQRQKFPSDNLLFLVSVKARFFEPVIPGDQLTIEAVPIKLMSKMSLVQIKIHIGDRKIAEAEIAVASKDAKTI